MANSRKLHLNIRVSGKVQGVWYRKSACEAGLRSGLTGFAQNLADGSVQMEAEGERKDLDIFIEWCNIGPPMAVVEHIYVIEGPVVGHQGFTVRR